MSFNWNLINIHVAPLLLFYSYLIQLISHVSSPQLSIYCLTIWNDFFLKKGSVRCGHSNLSFKLSIVIIKKNFQSVQTSQKVNDLSVTTLKLIPSVSRHSKNFNNWQMIEQLEIYTFHKWIFPSKYHIKGDQYAKNYFESNYKFRPGFMFFKQF